MRAFVIGLLLAIASVAVSQGPRENAGTAMLVFMPAVQVELKLTKAQKDELGKLMQSEIAAMRPPKSGNGKSAAPSRQDLVKRYAALEGKITKTLNSTQRTRLDQIGLQARGPMAMGDPAVAKRVGLSEVQRKKVESIAKKFQKDSLPMVQDLASVDYKERAKKVGTMRKAAETQILGGLNESQKKTWTAMLGKPFDLQSKMKLQRPSGAGAPAKAGSPGKGG